MDVTAFILKRYDISTSENIIFTNDDEIKNNARQVHPFMIMVLQDATDDTTRIINTKHLQKFSLNFILIYNISHIYEYFI
jgi:hypothetical protein